MTQSKPVATMLDVIEILNADPRVIAYPQLVADRAELIETLKYVLVESSSCRNVIRNLLRDLGEAQS